ncbi:hypothetical protein CWI36_0600p0010 [Hamiltosporidium magnivora]|uniref:Uncharacterized protein n=1 Tax=Hamiltosporidium magnivora TaxID=148818 RepID=A0A4Q9LCN7_9MICR|nr:hypothetical protein CWI36_0600p0010 [Hamiltosporidium magnivora]
MNIEHTKIFKIPFGSLHCTNNFYAIIQSKEILIFNYPIKFIKKYIFKQKLLKVNVSKNEIIFVFESYVILYKSDNIVDDNEYYIEDGYIFYRSICIYNLRDTIEKYIGVKFGLDGMNNKLYYFFNNLMHEVELCRIDIENLCIYYDRYVEIEGRKIGCRISKNGILKIFNENVAISDTYCIKINAIEKNINFLVENFYFFEENLLFINEKFISIRNMKLIEVKRMEYLFFKMFENEYIMIFSDQPQVYKELEIKKDRKSFNCDIESDQQIKNIQSIQSSKEIDFATHHSQTRIFSLFYFVDTKFISTLRIFDYKKIIFCKKANQNIYIFLNINNFLEIRIFSIKEQKIINSKLYFEKLHNPILNINDLEIFNQNIEVTDILHISARFLNTDLLISVTTKKYLFFIFKEFLIRKSNIKKAFKTDLKLLKYFYCGSKTLESSCLCGFLIFFIFYLDIEILQILDIFKCKYENIIYELINLSNINEEYFLQIIKFILKFSYKYENLITCIYRRCDKKENLLNLISFEYFKNIKSPESLRNIIVFFPDLLEKYIELCIFNEKEFLIPEIINYLDKNGDIKRKNCIEKVFLKYNCLYLLKMCKPEIIEDLKEMNVILKIEELNIQIQKYNNKKNNL